MRMVTSPYFPGQVFLIDERALMDFGYQPRDLDFGGFDERGNPLPYDHKLVPHGHEPAMLLSPGDWLHWHDRVRLNNDLIRIFGTVPKMPRFRYHMDFCIKQPRRDGLFFGNLSA